MTTTAEPTPENNAAPETKKPKRRGRKAGKQGSRNAGLNLCFTSHQCAGAFAEERRLWRLSAADMLESLLMAWDLAVDTSEHDVLEIVREGCMPDMWVSDTAPRIFKCSAAGLARLEGLSERHKCTRQDIIRAALVVWTRFDDARRANCIRSRLPGSGGAK